MCIDFHAKFPLLLQILMRLAYSRKVFKIKIPNFMKILPVEAECLLADGQTDIMKLIETFCKFGNGPKNKWDCSSTRTYIAIYGYGQH